MTAISFGSCRSFAMNTAHNPTEGFQYFGLKRPKY